MVKQEEVFYILQDVRLGNLSEYEATIKLHELGVVIRVDRELPTNKMSCSMRVIGEPAITAKVQEEIQREIGIWEECQQDMLKWHNDSLEPLIAEVKNE